MVYDGANLFLHRSNGKTEMKRMIWFSITIICTVLITISIIASNAFPQGGGWPVGEEYKKSFNNPAWVQWFQQNDWVLWVSVLGVILSIINFVILKRKNK